MQRFQFLTRLGASSISPRGLACLGLAAILLSGCGAPAVPATVVAPPLDTPAVAPTPTITVAAATNTPAATAGPTADFTATPAGVDPVLLAAGDIASCGAYGDSATAALITAQPGVPVLALGDIAYPDGSAQNLADCYAPTWGVFKDRTHPVPGNHDYVTLGAADYYAYFGAAAGPAGLGYYSFDLGAWHVIALNSNCGAVDCAAGSDQETWLKADLAAHPAKCTLAFWHHPMFNAGAHGDLNNTQDLWKDLYAAGAELILNGHDHDYQRFAPQDPSGAADPAAGIREFVVGTGGASLYHVTPGFPNLEAYNDSTYGVLKLTLHPAGYDWQFLPESGKTFTDTGSAACH